MGNQDSAQKIQHTRKIEALVNSRKNKELSSVPTWPPMGSCGRSPRRVAGGAGLRAGPSAALCHQELVPSMLGSVLGRWLWSTGMVIVTKGLQVSRHHTSQPHSTSGSSREARVTRAPQVTVLLERRKDLPGWPPLICWVDITRFPVPPAGIKGTRLAPGSDLSPACWSHLGSRAGPWPGGVSVHTAPSVGTSISDRHAHGRTRARARELASRRRAQASPGQRPPLRQ